MRIEDAYAKQELTSADRAAYEQSLEQGGQQSDAETASVPAVVRMLFASPYIYGPSVLHVLTTNGGNAAVDRTFRHGAFTQLLYLDPSTSLTGGATRSVDAPRLARGEKAVGSSSTFGAFDLYLVLASRIDPSVALDAALHWRGGQIRAMHANGSTCVRGAVIGDSAAGTEQIRNAMRAWSTAGAAGTAAVVPSAATASFRACDPGPDGSASPDDALQHAANILELHNSLEAGLIESAGGGTTQLPRLRCAALAYVQDPQLVALLDQPESNLTAETVKAAILAATPAARARCVGVGD